jgi:hypothetical protein
MKHLSGFFIICIAAIALSGCAPPVGSIYDSGGEGPGKGSDFDTLWIIPVRLFYESGHRFDPDEDLQIFSSDTGLVRLVSPDEEGVTITISESSLTGEPRNPTVVERDNPHRFNLPGIYFIEVGYKGKTARYTVEVRGYFYEPGDGSDFVNINWL